MEKINASPDATSDEQLRKEAEEMRGYFAAMDNKTLVDTCVAMYADSSRLRRELDDAHGVIR